MATIPKTIVKPQAFADTFVSTWETMGNNDTGEAMSMLAASDKSVQVSGTFSGAAVAIKGSNDGATYFTLSDPQGNTLSFTSAGLSAITEHTRYLRPETTGGAGTDIDVIVFMKGQSI